MNSNVVNKMADNIRILSAAMVEKAGSGHPGGAMGGADFVAVLYSEFLRFDPDNLVWPFRDRFFLDPGHMSPMLYSILSMIGAFSMEDIKNFRQWGSNTPGHPELDPSRGIENTSGPLGQGHTSAVGAAIAEKFLTQRFGSWMSHKIYTMISDGGIEEEIAQGAGRIAGFLGLGNLVMYFDANDVQLSTSTHEVTCEDTAKKYEAWGWRTKTINGNDPEEIHEALREANLEDQRPFLIIGKTRMGKGAVDEQGEPMPPSHELHGKALSKAGASIEKTIENLGGDPNDWFKIFPEVQEYLDQVKKATAITVAEVKEQQKEWEKENPELAKKLDQFLSGKIPEIDYSKIEQKEGIATRAASGKVLSEFAEQVENMIVASADLSESDKTSGFLEKSKAFKNGDFSGAFLQAGTSELTMGAIANGMALHGGVIPVCGTFLVFSDYMKPAVRLAALMELPVKYVWSHDAFRVGEDGPTHQPVEHEAQFRLMEQLKNHSGENSMLVLRPAEATETTVAWKMALENTKTPSALILSRQGIKDLPAKTGSTRFQDALEAEKGGYVVREESNPDIILVASGSEVSTLYEGAEKLQEKGIKARVVSVISEGLFKNQSQSYQKEVIPDNTPVFGMTAGVAKSLSDLVGCNGKVFSMESFGFSAPYKVLDEKLGFNADNVVTQVEQYLNEYKNK